jgi:predicted  nucleic acid-binding Zn-ribbon protein
MSNVKELSRKLEELRASTTSADSSLDELRSIHATLESVYNKLKDEHTTLQTDHNSLQSAHTELSTTLASQTIQITNIEQVRDELQGKYDAVQQTLTTVRADLAISEKRGESAERRRDALQEENGELVKRLEEVRGRVVEVMEEKVDLAEQVEGWKLRSKSWEKNSESSTSASESSKISSLESALQTSTLRIQSLTRELVDLHAAYAQAQRERDDALSSSSAFSPRGSRGQGLFLSPSEESPRPDRRAILGRTASGGVMDAILPASVRHKRQVSLTALKARMEPREARSKMDLLEEGEEGEEAETPGINSKVGKIVTRQQFGDEIVFCCPACEGDLFEL